MKAKLIFRNRATAVGAAAAAAQSIGEMLACVARFTLVGVAKAKRRNYLIGQRKQCRSVVGLRCQGRLRRESLHLRGLLAGDGAGNAGLVMVFSNSAIVSAS